MLAACSGIPLPTDLEQAQSLERGGNDVAALGAWRAIRVACKGPGARPHDDCGLAAVREAQLLERMGRDREAASAWEAVPALSTTPRSVARALVRAAEIHLEKLGDERGALALAWRCVVERAEEEPADNALALVVRVERRRDPVALGKHLDDLAERLRTTDLGDNLLYNAADLASQLHDGPGAVARFDELVRRWPHSALSDDANWRAAEILRRAHDPAGALERLARILRTRKDALFVGSYNSTLLDDAQLLTGEILRDDLHDLDRAAEAFTDLADNFPESTLRDDALLDLALTHLMRHAPPSANDTSRACAALARLAREYPEGNRARAGAELATRTACPR